jgi:hypothetical protein
MASVSQKDFLPKVVKLVQDHITQLEETREGDSRMMVDMLIILALANELEAYMGTDDETSLEPQDQALVLITQAMEEARQEYLELFVGQQEEDGAVWH